MSNSPAMTMKAKKSENMMQHEPQQFLQTLWQLIAKVLVATMKRSTPPTAKNGIHKYLRVQVA